MNVVIGDILPYTQATAVQNQTVFGTNWTANAASDVVVYYTPVNTAPNDATQILSYPSQYSVAFIGGSQQVQVTLVTPAANNGDIVTITRQTPADYLNLYSNTNFTPSMLNNDFGILTLVDQQAQLVNQLIGPRYNYSAVIVDVVDTILPILTANQTWAKNPTNTGFVGYTLPPVTSGIAPANATYILQTANSSLPNAQALSALGANSLLAWNNGTHQITATSILGTANEITVTNGDGNGTIGLSIPANPVMPGTGAMGIPGGTTLQRVVTSGTPLRYNSTIDSLEFYSNGVWHLISDDNDGIINPGLQNQLAYYAAAGSTLSGLTGVNSGSLVTSLTGVPTWLGPLTNGQIIIGSTGAIPIATTITQGAGVTITNGPGSITIAATGSGGTVTTFSAGNLSPLFTTSVANPTSTPALSFTLSNAGANTYFGNATNGSAAPSYTTAGALTKTDDANVTLTLGGSPTVALLANASLTLGWTGQLSLARGGTNANLTATANNLVYSTASALALLATANSGALVTSAGGVPSISTQLPAGMTIASDPSTNLGIATKQYVDQTALNGTSVYAASAASLGTVTQVGAGIGATLTNAGAQATFSLDGVNPPVGSNVLIKNTATGMTAANEGVYTVTNAGSGVTNWILTRATDYDTPTEINNTGLIVIQNGSTLAGQAWYNSATITVVDTTNFNFNRFGTSGTVTSVATAGLATGGPITTSGTVTVTAAVKADMEAATSNTVAVTPGTVGFAPTSAVAWGYVDNTGSLINSFNVTSVNNTGTGAYTATFVPALTGGYCALTGLSGTGLGGCTVVGIPATSTTVHIQTFDATNTLANSIGFCFTIFGIQS